MKIWSIEEEAAHLKRRFTGVNRSAFAREFGLKGGHALIYQHINGLRPISLEAAKVYAEGFGCTLDDISPRLAQEVAQAAAYAGASAGGASDGKPLWPFSTPIFTYRRLSPAQKAKLDSTVTAFIEACLESKRR